jgi:CBS domain containing-hemolysin-like protein
MENFVLIIIALLLVLLNGVFVAAEFGLVKLRSTRVKALGQSHGLRGQVLEKVHSRLDAYLSACQLGITLASLALGWIGEPAFVALLEPVLGWLGISAPQWVHGISLFVAFFTISFLHIVVGELAPKSMALREPERVSVWTAIPLYGFYWSMYPAIWLLNVSANHILRLAGLDPDSHHDSHYSIDELKLILRSSRPAAKASHDEWNIMAAAIDFSDLDVSDLMRPINEVVALSSAKSAQENLDIIRRHSLSRYPYFNEENHSVAGVIHVKDLFFAMQNNKPLDDLKPFLRPVLHVAPNMSALELFHLFRQGAPHLAVIGLPAERVQGFLTFDNLLGSLVGEIRDEFRQSNHDWLELDDHTLLGKGSMPLVTLEHMLGITIDIGNETIASIGGLIQWRLGNLPKEGERIEFDGFSVVVKKMNGPRIVLVRVHPQKKNAQDN